MIIYRLALLNWYRNSLIKTTIYITSGNIINKRMCSACRLEACLYLQWAFLLAFSGPAQTAWEHCIPVLCTVTLEPREHQRPRVLFGCAEQQARAVWKQQAEVQLSRKFWRQETKVQVQRSNLQGRTESKQTDTVPNSKGQVMDDGMLQAELQTSLSNGRLPSSFASCCLLTRGALGPPNLILVRQKSKDACTLPLNETRTEVHRLPQSSSIRAADWNWISISSHNFFH